MSPESARAAGEAVLDRLRTEAAHYGVELPGLVWESAHFDWQRDPLSGLDALLARWQCAGRSVQLGVSSRNGKNRTLSLAGHS